MILDLPFVAKVYPLVKAVSFVIKSEDLQTCEFFDCATFNDDILVCFKRQKMSETFDIVKIGSARLEIGKRKFSIESDNWKKIITLTNSFDKYQTSSMNNFLLVKFTGESQIVYACNLKSGAVKAFRGDKVEFLKDGFAVDAEGQQKKYNISTQGLTLAKGESDNVNTMPETLAYHFLHSIKNADLTRAHSLLDENLQKSITKSALKSFFGNISDFFYLSPERYAVQNEKQLKIFNFKIEGGKITDISD